MFHWVLLCDRLTDSDVDTGCNFIHLWGTHLGFCLTANGFELRRSNPTTTSTLSQAHNYKNVAVSLGFLLCRLYPNMRFATPLSLLPLLLPFLSPVHAQDNITSYVQDWLSTLQGAGFTGLADTLTRINETTPGQALFSELSSGRNFTVFAPNNEAGVLFKFDWISWIYIIICISAKHTVNHL